MLRRSGPSPDVAEERQAGGLPVPAQLPPAVTDFIGRTGELIRLNELAEAAADNDSTAVPIVVIAGGAGIGKTTLAVEYGHRIVDRFPDGQLYLDLRGFSPGPPVDPAEALGRCLRALGVPAERIPVHQEEQTALYRSALAGRRTLIVLNNAATVEQVRPLLPGQPGCLVLVTSRDRLTGLTARDGARVIELSVLSPDEAYLLVVRILDDKRMRDEPTQAAELVKRCAYLPLALRIAAANLAADPHRSIGQHLTQMNEDNRLRPCT